MIGRLMLVALAALCLAGCNTFGCGAAANNRNQAGSCTTGVTF